jgi:hypothetical protein
MRFIFMLGKFGKIAAHQKMPIADFPGSRNKQGGVLPGVLPADRTFCPRPMNSAVQLEQPSRTSRHCSA